MGGIGGPGVCGCVCVCVCVGGGVIDFIFTLRTAVSEIQADFQNCHRET